MNEEAFAEWSENPVTEYFLKYLDDSIKYEAELLTDLIKGGGIVERDEQVRISTICATLTDIRDIEYAEIETFYDEKE